MSTNARSGQCLCGAVTFRAEPLGSVNACHCSECQRWGGGPLMAVPCKNAEFEGEVRAFPSSDVATRDFCPACGSHVAFRPKAGPVVGIPLGLFDDPGDLAFKAQFFTDEKAPHYEFANETACLTGAEFLAKFRAG